MKFIEHQGKLYQYSENQLFATSPGRYTPVFYDVPDSLYGKIISRQTYSRGGLPKGMYFVITRNYSYLRVSHISTLHPERNTMFIKGCSTIGEWRKNIQAGFGVLENIFDLPKYVIDDYENNIDNFLELIGLDGKPLLKNEDFLQNGFPTKVRCSLRTPTERDRDFGVYVHAAKGKKFDGKKSMEQVGFMYRDDVDFFRTYEDSFLRSIKKGIITQHDFRVIMEGADEVRNYAENMLQDVHKAIRYEGIKKDLKHAETV